MDNRLITFENLKTFATEVKRSFARKESAYPVGSIYISVNETNPADIFGFGTWQQIKDKFLLASGDTYTAGSEGGEAEHTLTEDEMPSHTHELSDPTITTTTNGTQNIGTSTIFGGYKATTISETQETGGGLAHNNMPPYLAVYMFVRTA